MPTITKLTPSQRLRLEQIRDGNVKANVRKDKVATYVTDGEKPGRVTTGMVMSLQTAGLVKRTPAAFGTHTLVLTAKGAKVLA